MKFRLGFVSNSSSCSFYIHGVFLDNKDLRKLFDHPCEFEELAISNKFDVYTPPSAMGTYVGISYEDMKDNETKGKFKSRVQEQLKKLFDSMPKKDISLSDLDLKFRDLSDGWYDG